MSGNKFWYILVICSALAACSPRARTNRPSKKDEGKKNPAEAVKAEKKFTAANISLLVPFNLNAARISSGNKAEIEKSAMAIDFYQGFRMGIDSAAHTGLNFTVNVMDTRDSGTEINALIKSGKLTGTDLIVGPVYPEGIKIMTNYSIANHVPMVSPLAATSPAEFNNSNLISLVGNISLHAEKIGDYILRTCDPAGVVVVLISTRKAGDEILAAPLRNYFKQGRASGYTFQEYSSVFTMELNMIPGKRYLLLLASAERQFVIPTIDKLIKLKNAGTDIQLFGHPTWSKQNYNTEKLQQLRTRITSTYTVDYKSQAVIAFVRNYRSINSLEPGEYAFKGFDTGLYFGRLLAAHGAAYRKYLTQEPYKGLQNSFAFLQDQESGYINTSVSLLEYKNYALNPIE